MSKCYTELSHDIVIYTRTNVLPYFGGKKKKRRSEEYNYQKKKKKGPLSESFLLA